ncbi:hypothetical protein CYJ57_06060 [Falseniella ignava]|uniref:Uncharacterized protein n=1 Tax=Falseniella ignava TaxID=137730 RepID=A0A2I1JXR9_9LACT|nr:hypothetical protein [Falseniella ignava]PKY88174.1 hypothetical protein CYJ57_06060 [Falseniella ignava]
MKKKRRFIGRTELIIELFIIIGLLTVIYLLDRWNAEELLKIFTDGTFVAAALSVPITLSGYIRNKEREDLEEDQQSRRENELKQQEFYNDTLDKLEELYVETDDENYHDNEELFFSIKFLKLHNVLSDGQVIQDNPNLVNKFYHAIKLTYIRFITYGLDELLEEEVACETATGDCSDRLEDLFDIHQALERIERRIEQSDQEFKDLFEAEEIGKFIRRRFPNVSWKEVLDQERINEAGAVTTYFYKPAMQNITIPAKLEEHYVFSPNIEQLDRSVREELSMIDNIYPSIVLEPEEIPVQVERLPQSIVQAVAERESEYDTRNELYHHVKSFYPDAYDQVRVSVTHSPDHELVAWFTLREEDWDASVAEGIDTYHFIIIDDDDLTNSAIISFESEAFRTLLLEKLNDPAGYVNDKYQLHFTVDSDLKLHDHSFEEPRVVFVDREELN